MECFYRSLSLLRCGALLHSLFAAGVAPAWFVIHWITAQKRGFVFSCSLCGPIRSYCRYLRSIASFLFHWLNCACSRRGRKQAIWQETSQQLLRERNKELVRGSSMAF